MALDKFNGIGCYSSTRPICGDGLRQSKFMSKYSLLYVDNMFLSLIKRKLLEFLSESQFGNLYLTSYLISSFLLIL
ncbi:hypothetical protein BpHYR1_040684 [Brachionus plicatilis]|uniref:Uncharacterized protein n=1 Tax=Brachionus plicatilis TaxID=10195 RepID=A0A3M7PWW1_BRAPC|nr:hypothetical protein BpHYR1_040684 [Brachionus plicatilis]